MFEAPKYPCVNCEGPIPWAQRIKVYCSNFCQEQAKDIRWIRSTIARGVYDNPDIIEARQIRIGHLNSGGYKSLGRKLPVETRMIVSRKYDYKCAKCGIKAIPGEIDHISGSSNSLENLQFLCSPCHRKKTLENIRTVSDSDSNYDDIALNSKELRNRSLSPTPLKSCDDHFTWAEKRFQIQEERKNHYHRIVIAKIQPFLDEKLSVSAISMKIIEFGIPSFSDVGKWSKRQLSSILKDNGVMPKYNPKTGQTDYLSDVKFP